MDYRKLREEALKDNIKQDYFKAYYSTVIGNIDLVIAKHNTSKGMKSLFEEFENDNIKSILWAEAKQGTNHDIYESFVQLILTIGKEKTYEKHLPPKYIGAFDAEKFAFIEYHKIQDVFYQNDFNWNVTPSNHDTKEFKQLYNMCKNLLENNSILFFYDKDDKEFKDFITLNFKTGSEITEKISVTKNNFTFVFQRWLVKVKPTIDIDWAEANKENIISADFFLADLISDNNESIKDNLNVVLKRKEYYYNKERKKIGGFSFDTVGFKDKQKAHKEFWNIYKRPPKEEYWEYMIRRRDLLVPQDIREIKGSYFTPKIWVEKSQQYLADVLGENWQDEYYIWDCCAGTGNLLNGLVNKRNIWASTLDKPDVEIMKDMVSNGWNMFEDHIFQFDFLNDDFSKCPEELQEILNDEEKRKKLVIYINPPYAEATSLKTITNSDSKHKAGISSTKTYDKYKSQLGRGINEIYAHFFIKIFYELKNCILGNFSTLKILQSQNFNVFRNNFTAKLEKLFIIPANTFDNVTGQFPIGFFIWDTKKYELFKEIQAEVFSDENKFLGTKKISIVLKNRVILNWLQNYYDKKSERLAYLVRGASDFQNNNIVFLSTKPSQAVISHSQTNDVTKNNIIQNCIFFAIRRCTEMTWLNNRDQFLYPNDNWQTDLEFQCDCLIFTLFHNQNVVSAEHGPNHWIPFTEQQVGCKKSFKSHFMSDFLQGKIKIKTDADLFSKKKSECIRIELSPKAQSVYDAGLELWKYYHSQSRANPDASFYDIREYFQGKTNGRMNTKSDDETYNELISDLRNKMKLLAKQIEPKVYEYGFLK